MAKRHAHPAHQSQSRILQETEVYLMSIPLYLFVSKWGISDKTTTRRAQVDKGIAGPVWLVTSANLPFGWRSEGIVHFLYFFFNVTRWIPEAFKGASGRTEIFFNANPVFGMFFVWACHTYQFTPPIWGFALAFCFPFLWVDGWLFVQFFRLFWWVFAAALAYGSWWFFVNA